ncbi:peptide chain release factor N(5)-glutamine methyltransferase [Corynebacterium epidermidicanis]|uniref:Release factor glutamine methyltransferase n=1 Tax=Corynebacterium epidermidicanis TaxID=1050174 RepID=A0A0G3GNS5_9CORY|nr:peptide chain release factor N(5)-glutamine methyltransferase [Corynebacterium epidermidicanis]AKK02881.1 protein-(glutamine-N5) methyltransferase, release factor-specific [Corynebacterium epidermidicanis]
MSSVAAAVAEATATLTDAGVASPLFDAQTLAASVLGIDRMQLIFSRDAEMPEAFFDLVAQRAARVPLQHIVGSASFGPLELAVGPGVFIPRPETELLALWALEQVEELQRQGVEKPRVLDLCTGSGALALYVASRARGAEVHAVELDPQAAAWTRRNIAAHAPWVELTMADVTAPGLLAGEAAFDVIVSNPPYVPASTPVSPEVQADPQHAVFSGESGMDCIVAMMPNVVALSRPGTVVGIEHDDATSAQVVDVFGASGQFEQVQPRQDLAGRLRFVTARRRGE